MRPFIIIVFVLITISVQGQVGLQLTNQDVKLLVGWDEPAEVGVQAVATLSYNLNNQVHVGFKTGLYIQYDHLISLDLKFFGQHVRGQMATLEYHYNIVDNLLIGVQLNTQRVGVSAIYMLPTGSVGSGCY
jgi:hypothetical protein